MDFFIFEDMVCIEFFVIGFGIFVVDIFIVLVVGFSLEMVGFLKKLCWGRIWRVWRWLWWREFLKCGLGVDRGEFGGVWDVVDNGLMIYGE